MEGDVHGVRIVPPQLIFDSTVPGSSYCSTVTVKNVSNGSKTIRYYRPKSNSFVLKVKNPEEPVASGLSVTAAVEYKPDDETEKEDKLVVSADGEIVEIPIVAYPIRPLLNLPSSVDFGTLISDNKVVSREITLVNSGSKSGQFHIKYSGKQPIVIIPSSGSVPPNSIQTVRVEFVSMVPGEFNEIATVSLEGRAGQTLTISGHVSQPTLELLSMTDEQPIDQITFDNTYYGTDNTKCALLYNNSPEMVNFVAIIDEDAVGQEMGIDLTQAFAAALLEESDSERRGCANDMASLISAIPNQGILQPYQKIPIYFRFRPRWNIAKLGWKSQALNPPRKDFALFVQLDIVGSNSGLAEDDAQNEKAGSAVVALIGTALPVLLDIIPLRSFDFGECPVGQRIDVQSTLYNDSTILPVTYQFRRIAHFTVHPCSGKIPPGETHNVVFSFVPKQVGMFKSQLILDVIGQVADNSSLNFLQVVNCIISSLPVTLIAQSNPITLHPKARFNPGLTPLITNEVGMYCEKTFADKALDLPRNALAGSNQTRYHMARHRTKSLDVKDDQIRIAFPNDLARSLKPSERNQKYQTMFTRMDRYSSVDPDYAYSDDDIISHHTHDLSYLDTIHQRRNLRHLKMQTKEHFLTDNATDIGIKSAAGILPKVLKLSEIKPEAPDPPIAGCKLLSTRDILEAEREAMSKPVQEGLKAVPTTEKEKAGCKKKLGPQELHQILIGPPTLKFGKVCLRSVSQKDLNIINNLQHHILVEAEVHSRELRQSSPLSQVVPPRSRTVLPIIFESDTVGTFQRCVTYTINNFYKHHVTVLAEVVPVGLQLSSRLLTLKPSLGLPPEAGYRGIISLNNNLNQAAEFTWSPNFGERGTAFSIRPASGTVEPNNSLDCEVVWHSSFLAPEDGSFTLLVHGGKLLTLVCHAEIGATGVHFLDHRLMFGSIPVNLSTTRIATLSNNGPNHAYFQVLDTCSVPGLVVSPVSGVVPMNGTIDLRLVLTPDTCIKFDNRLTVAIRGGKQIELRMGGSVEPPSVEIDVNSFTFGGVYCGSKHSLPFKIMNKGHARCKLEFDLSHYRDFKLNFAGFHSLEENTFQLLNSGMTSVGIAPLDTVEGQLIFEPKEVAAYDFIIPVSVNHLVSDHHHSAPASKSSVNLRPGSVTFSIPRKHVIATALRQPLQLSHTHIEFVVPAGVHEMAMSFTSVDPNLAKNTVLVNNCAQPLQWGLDFRGANKALESGIFSFHHSSGVPFICRGEGLGIEGALDPGQTIPITVVFCPKVPGTYECVVPVILNEDWDAPYQFLNIVGRLLEPKVWFDPPGITLIPVPLLIETTCEFNILATQYTRASEVRVETPEIECEDGSKIKPLKVIFLHGTEISPCSGGNGQIDPCCLPCKVIFSSPKPMSFIKPIIFLDSEGRSFTLVVSATADNCLFTCYPFLARHRMDNQIVRKQTGAPDGNPTTLNEAMIVLTHANNKSVSRPSTASTATSTGFDASFSTFEKLSSISESSLPRDGAMNRSPSRSDIQSRNQQSRSPVTQRIASAMFSDEESDEGMFHMDVLTTVQRWFSAYGWSGTNPVTIPDTFRNGISRRPHSDEEKSASSSKKDNKTIYEMINHLSGRPVPGIPVNSQLPSDPIERVKQIYWQHSTFLTFLKCQGACLAAIRPEYLMGNHEFVVWKQFQTFVTDALLKKGKEEEVTKLTSDTNIDEEMFDAISKRAWTDTLLQILKVLVLAKITPRSYRNLQPADRDCVLPPINLDPLASNIYSVAERILLSWLNYYYENYRERIWNKSKRGGVPPSRWVVNFDFDLLDGLVLGALLGAYMPFLIKTHLVGMYTHPNSAEQCLHNALKVVGAMTYAGIECDIQAIDITDPNPVTMLLLLYHLYHLLPQYLPRANLDFLGSLHSTIVRPVKVNNPSGKSVTYQVLLVGRDAQDFSLSKGHILTIQGRQTVTIPVEFKSRFLRPAEAMLVLVGSRLGLTPANTLTFNLRTKIDNMKPTLTLKVESSCYELEHVHITVKNPFTEAGRFQIVLIESHPDTFSKTADLDKQEKEKNEQEKSPPKSKKGKGKTTSKSTAKSDAPSCACSPKKESTLDSLIGKKQGLCSFFCSTTSVYLESQASMELDVSFLPFTVGEHNCSVLFLNETLGEFLYTINAMAILPLTSPLPYVVSSHSVFPSTATQSDSLGSVVCNEEEEVVYWKCETNQTIQERVLIPVSNHAKERAVLYAAYRHMSEEELQRRAMTGTLSSYSVALKTLKKVAADPDALVEQIKPGSQSGLYTIECDSEFFHFPASVNTKAPHKAHYSISDTTVFIPKGVNLESGVLEVVVQFHAKNPGYYPCQIIMRSVDDIRVYRFECVVSTEGSVAEIVFNSPAQQSVVQDIPIVNLTHHDWTLVASITGDVFSGPPTLVVRTNSKAVYPLACMPVLEKDVEGKLILRNIDDDVEHVFHLISKAEKPLPIEHIKLRIEAKKSISHTVRVPNITKKKLLYKVQSDIPFLTGKETISVLPCQFEKYTLILSPKKCGHQTGLLAFVAGKNPMIEYDSDGDEVLPDEEARLYDGFCVWYSLDITVVSAPAEQTIFMSCACQKKMVMDVIVRNPTPEDITLTATLTGQFLEGLDSITLGAGEKDVYSVVFAPSHVGKNRGSLVFFNELVGEFWYELELEALPPAPTTLPYMKCELGKWAEQTIKLSNPTKESLELTATVSNANNFILQGDDDLTFMLPPFSTIEVPLHFRPTGLGRGDHKSKIVFSSRQFGEWVFWAFGTGLLPSVQDPISVNTATSTTTTFIVNFHNPTDLPVLASIETKDLTEDSQEKAEEQAFALLLKNSKANPIGPRSTFEIPFSFAPTEMHKYEMQCIVTMIRQDGHLWPVVAHTKHSSAGSISEEEGMREIKWVYPVHGVPEAALIKDAVVTVFECIARDSICNEIEVDLAGALPAASGSEAIQESKLVVLDPAAKCQSVKSVGTHRNSVTDVFASEIVSTSDGLKEILPRCVALNLLSQQNIASSGVVKLFFSLKFTPFRTMSYLAYLQITGASGGLWKFPIRFVATEAPVDDLIKVESTGLGKLSTVKFKLYSQNKNPTIFKAHFVQGSDAELSVSPQFGELLPKAMDGTSFTIQFTPQVYGRTYKGKLVIQTTDMQWSYDVRGVLPKYSPPKGITASLSTGSHCSSSHSRRKPNSRKYIQENIQLLTTAVSSPVKGAPLVHHGQD